MRSGSVGGRRADPRYRVRWVVAAVVLIIMATGSVASAQSGKGAGLIAQAPVPPRAPEAAPPGAADARPPAPPPPTIPSTPAPVFPEALPPGPTPPAMFGLGASVALAEEYTDNFNLSRDDKQENYRTTLSPSLNLFINAAFTQGQIGYTPSGVYDSSSDDTDLFHAGAGRISYQATPFWRLTASDVLSQSDEPGQADQLNLRRERRTFTRNTVSLDSDYAIATLATKQFYAFSTFDDEGGPDTTSHVAGASASLTFFQRTTATLGYQFLRSDTAGGGSDVDGHQASASVARRLNPFASIGLSGSYGYRIVESLALGPEGETREEDNDYVLWSVSLFAEYGIPEAWSIAASVGYSELDGRGKFPDDSSVTGGLSLTVRLAEATLTLSGDAGFSETFATGENFGVVRTRGVRGSVSYPLTPFVAASASGFYRRNDFTQVAVSGEERTKTGQSEDAWGGSVTLSLRLLRWLTLALEYTYTEADSAVPEREYVENRARAALTAAF